VTLFHANQPNFPPALPSDKHLPIEYPKRVSNKGIFFNFGLLASFKQL
jgi:hypothetical protein